MQRVAALGQVDNVLAMEGVVGHRTVHGFLHSPPFAVVLERRHGADLAHLLGLSVELYALEPFEIAVGAAYLLGRIGAAIAIGHLQDGAVVIIPRGGQELIYKSKMNYENYAKMCRFELYTV